MKIKIDFLSPENAVFCILICFCFVLFTSTTLFVYPLLTMALLGISGLFKNPGSIARIKKSAIVPLFLAIWLPMLLSLPDAYNKEAALEKTLLYFLFLPFCLYAVNRYPDQKSHLFCSRAILLVLLFFMFDASIQFLFDRNLFGYPYTPPQLKGMFYPKVRLPYFMAMLAPLYLEFLRQKCKSPILYLLLIVWFLLVILLCGKRTAWLMLVFSSSLYFVCLFLFARQINFKRCLAGLFAVLLALLSLYTLHEPTHKRIHNSLAMFLGDKGSLDKSTAFRASLWDVAIKIGTANPINGIGPRGYRHAFQDYADKDNFWLQKDRHGQTHPHQFTLEVFSETGVPGLLGLVIFFSLLGRKMIRQLKAGKVFLLPWYIASLTAFLPLNSHLAFYGSYWASVCWWILAITLFLTALDYAHEKDPGY